jgi:hypothetical protein
MNSFCNERYSENEFVYGEAPNVFFAETLSTLKQGVIIPPCDGEGRNAVHAASEGEYHEGPADIIRMIATKI